MRKILFVLLAALAIAAGCHRQATAPPKLAADDIVGVYARQRNISRQQAEQCIRDELASARAHSVSSTAAAPAGAFAR